MVKPRECPRLTVFSFLFDVIPTRSISPRDRASLRALAPRSSTKPPAGQIAKKAAEFLPPLPVTDTAANPAYFRAASHQFATACIAATSFCSETPAHSSSVPPVG